MGGEIMRGVYPILATPFDAKDRIDVDDLRREVDFVLDRGAHGVGIALASEIAHLSEAEREEATRTVVDQVGGRAPVVVNTGGASAALTLRYSRRAEEQGAAAVMITPPVGVGARAVREQYRSVSDAITLPIFIQDVPTASVSPRLAGEMAREIERVRYIKAENPPTPASVAAFVESGGECLTVFGGAGGAFFIEEMRRGSQGAMPHAAFPDLFRAVWDIFHTGDQRGAIEAFNRMTPLLRVITQGAGSSSLHVVKEALRIRGVFSSVHVRSPDSSISALAAQELREALDIAGVRV